MLLLSGLLCLVASPAVAQMACLNFDTSLHATREGKAFWYSAENGGFEQFTNIPIEELGCLECHGPTDADGNPYDHDVVFQMDCSDCHPGTWFPVSTDQCYGCHGRQATEVKLGLQDVHRTAGMVCWDCHTSEDMHGDGTEYVSMLEPGAIDADCENCHNDDAPAELQLPDGHPDPHGGKVHCAACHAQTVISCYNCHFESQVAEHVKRAKQPLKDFVILANREKDGKVYPMSFQSVTYDGNAFVAFGPFSPHTIMEKGRGCPDCHANFGGDIPAINEYNATGEIHFATWDEDTKTLSHLKGIVPMPADYETSFKMDFLTYTGDLAEPPHPGTDWEGIGKNTWDGHQMFFASPLTVEQMQKLGFQITVNQPPDVDAGGPYNGTVGQPVQFDASGTTDPEGDPLTFIWDFGDGSAVVETPDALVSHSYAAAGSYTATLVVDDGHQQTDPVPVSVEISEPSAGETWVVRVPLMGQQFQVSFEPFAGILIVTTTYPDGSTAIGMGMEFNGVIFWMDPSGAIYFGSKNAAEGTMSGIIFGGIGGSSIWFAEAL